MSNLINIIIVASIFSLIGNCYGALLSEIQFDDFEKVGIIAEENPVINPTGNAPEIVTAEDGVTPRSGTKMMKVHLERDTSPVTYRTEAAIREVNPYIKGKEYWIGFSVFLPEDWGLNYTSGYSEGIVWQFHDKAYLDTTNYRNILPLTVMHTSNGWNIRNFLYPDQEPSATLGQGSIEFFSVIVPYNLGHWVDFVFHVKFSGASSPNDTKGFLKVWVDGKQVVDQIGQNYFGEQPGPNSQFGIYNWGWRTKYEEYWTGPSRRTLYYDEVRVGNENSSYAEVTPEGRPDGEKKPLPPQGFQMK